MTSLLPTHGPVAGNTIITVGGTFFINSVDLVCRMGSHIPKIVATWVSSTQLLCLSPPETSSTNQIFEISNNNQDFTTDGLEYLYEGSDDISTVGCE